MTAADKSDGAPLRRTGRTLVACTLAVAGALAAVAHAAPTSDEPPRPSPPDGAMKDDGYDLVVGPAPAVRAKGRGAVSLSLVPRAGHRLLADGPVLVRLRATGVTPPRTLYQREDAVDPRADVPRFELALAADKPGPARIDADITFYVCKLARCRPVETTASWTFDVAP